MQNQRPRHGSGNSVIAGNLMQFRDQRAHARPDVAGEGLTQALSLMDSVNPQAHPMAQQLFAGREVQPGPNQFFKDAGGLGDVLAGFEMQMGALHKLAKFLPPEQQQGLQQLASRLAQETFGKAMMGQGPATPQVNIPQPQLPRR